MTNGMVAFKLLQIIFPASYVRLKSLERIRLVFGRLVDGILIPGDNDNMYAQDSITLLVRLAQHTMVSVPVVVVGVFILVSASNT